MSEEPPTGTRNANGEDDGDDESPGLGFHTVDEVHTEHRGDQRGYHHDDGDGGQGTHHRVHIVVDDTLVGVHRRFQDVGVDEGGLAGLCHLDVDILDEVGIEFVNLQFEFQFGKQRLVASDGGLEVRERVLQTAQTDQTLVVHFLVEVALGLIDEHRDLFQTFQVPDGTGKEDAEDHIDMVGEPLAALLLERDEVDHHIRLVETDGDGDVALVDDTERYGGIWRTAPNLLDVGDTEDDEHPTVVVLITGTLVGIVSPVSSNWAATL